MTGSAEVLRSSHARLVRVAALWLAIAIGLPAVFWSLAIVYASGLLAIMVWFVAAIPLVIIPPLLLSVSPTIATIAVEALYRAPGRPSLLMPAAKPWRWAAVATLVPELLVVLSGASVLDAPGWSLLLLVHIFWLVACAWQASQFALLDGNLWRVGGRMRLAGLFESFQEVTVERVDPADRVRVHPGARPIESDSSAWRTYVILKEGR
jgi:hypothetical protein